MKDVLQGKAIKHPLHPALVHLPIGLFVLSFVLDAASLLTRTPGLPAISFCMIAMGVVTGLIAAVPGVVDYSGIRRDHPARKTATWHMLLNIAMILLYAMNLGIRHDEIGAARVGWIPFILSVAGIALLSVSGYLGGSLVYDDGIGVGRHRRAAQAPEETTEARVSEGAGYVSVGVADRLREGETLRVKIRGTVMVVTRRGDEFFAFQEFCTHRFGPLSEGAIHGDQVECPWHRSCFNIRTGEVTKGPAKMPLKTFDARVREGQIEVRVPADT